MFCIFGKGWATPLGQRTTQGSEKNFFLESPFFVTSCTGKEE